MNISRIRDIVIDKDLPDEAKHYKLIFEISKDEHAVETVLELLAAERRRKGKMISEMNALLSQGDVMLDNPELNRGNFFQQKVKEFYSEWKEFVNHLYRQTKQQ